MGRLLTPFYEVYVAQSGGFRLLVDRASGRKLMAPPKTSGTLSGMIDGVDCLSIAEKLEAQIEAGRARLIETGRIGGIPYRSEWTFYQHTRRIDWRGELHLDRQLIGRPKAHPRPEEDRPWYERDEPLASVRRRLASHSPPAIRNR